MQLRFPTAVSIHVADQHSLLATCLDATWIRKGTDCAAHHACAGYRSCALSEHWPCIWFSASQFGATTSRTPKDLRSGTVLPCGLLQMLTETSHMGSRQSLKRGLRWGRDLHRGEDALGQDGCSLRLGHLWSRAGGVHLA